MERYRVLSDQSKLPGKYDMTPFGEIGQSMHDEISAILNDVKQMERLPLLHFLQVGLQHRPMHH